MTDHPPPTFDVPADAETVRCPHCGRPLESDHRLALHVGEHHADTMGEPERERYEAAYDAEADELFVLHMKVIAAIVIVTFGFVYLYAFVLT